MFKSSSYSNSTHYWLNYNLFENSLFANKSNKFEQSIVYLLYQSYFYWEIADSNRGYRTHKL